MHGQVAGGAGLGFHPRQSGSGVTLLATVPQASHCVVSHFTTPSKAVF